MDKLPPEYVERINRSFDAHARIQSQSLGAKSSFHEKLAVLTAGSLALAFSAVGVLSQKSSLGHEAMRWLFLSLTTSMILLWLSLVASVVHNLLASYALDDDAEVLFAESSLNLLRGLASLDQIKEEFATIEQRLNTTFTDYQQHHNDRASHLRGWASRLSLAAVSLFVLGYLSVVGYAIILANEH